MGWLHKRHDVPFILCRRLVLVMDDTPLLELDFMTLPILFLEPSHYRAAMSTLKRRLVRQVGGQQFAGHVL
jgi:hypothetical protein